MELMKTLPWLVLIVICLLHGGLARLCDNSNPIIQKAYVGPYDLDFPMTIGTKSRSAPQPSRCTFKIQTYRKDYVIQLQFEKTNLSKNKKTGVCKDRIIVYDGPTTASSIIASFCDGTPDLVTSSDEALIVYSQGSDSIDTRSRLFRVKYKAVVRHRDNGDTSQVLRIGFGSFIGVIAFIVVCSGVCRKYKKAHPNRSFFQFGRSRAGSNVSTSSSSEVNGVRGVQRSAARPQENRSLRGKITGFFEAILIKLTPARYIRENESTTSTNNRGMTLTPAEQLRRAGQAVHLRNSRARNSTDGGRASSLGTASGLEFGHADCMESVSSEALGDHVIFGYQNVPSCSFTSDPAAVKPPTYEEVVNNVNPLYLYHHNRHEPGTYSNPVFNMKDEPIDPDTALSPPPPYSEVHLDPEVATQGQGRDLMMRNGNPNVGQGHDPLARNVNPNVGQGQGQDLVIRDGDQNVGQGQVSAVSISPLGSSVDTRDTIQGGCPTTWAHARAPTAPSLAHEVQNSTVNGVSQGDTSNPFRDGNERKGGRTSDTAESSDLELASCLANEAVGSCSNTLTSRPTAVANSTSCPTTPPRNLLSIAASSPRQSFTVTAESGDSPSLDDCDEVGGARRREAARDADVTVGVGGARVHMTAENKPTAPLTPVYLSQDDEGETPRRNVDGFNAASTHNVSQIDV